MDRNVLNVRSPYGAEDDMAKQARLEQPMGTRDSGVYTRSATPTDRPPTDRARVLLCVLGMSDPATERSVSRMLDGLPWTESARELTQRLLRSRDPEAGARAVYKLALHEGALALPVVLRHITRRCDESEIDAVEARWLGAALRAADRARAVEIVRAQVANPRADLHREMWKRIAVGVAKG